MPSRRVFWLLVAFEGWEQGLIGIKLVGYLVKPWPSGFLNIRGDNRKNFAHLIRLVDFGPGAVAQLGERYNGIVEVRGSIPLGSTIKFNGLALAS